MNKLTQALMEELTVEYVKVGPLQIPESVVISWVIMVLVVLGSILLTRNLKVDHISKRQAVLEMAYTAGKNFFEGLLGKEGACYVPYLMTVAIYIACSNLIGVFGVKPPTKDLDVTAALALMSIVLIEGSGIRARGGVGFLKSLAAPTPVMTPMNILEIAIRPTSLCMRLFGNVLGAFVIMELIKLVVPVFVPAVFSLYFDLFDGLIQTYVFVFLTSLFMKESIGGEEQPPNAFPLGEGSTNLIIKEILLMNGLIALGAGIAALTGIGGGIGIGIATGKATEAISRQPEASSKIQTNLLLGAALAEGTAIFGFVVALLIILFLG